MRFARFLKRQLSFHKKHHVTSPDHRPGFVFESLEPRLLLSGTPMPTTEMPLTEPAVTAAIVTTDKADYSPGETAIITTSNTEQEGAKFSEGEMVQFQVTRTDGIEDYPMGNLPWYVTDGVGGFEAYQDYDATTGQAVDRNNDGMADWIRPDNDLTVNGSIRTDWFVEAQYSGATLLLTATGQQSGTMATHEFTDAPTASATFNLATVQSGNAVTLTVTNTSSGSGGTPNIGSIQVAVPTGVIVSGTPTVVATDSNGSLRSWSYDAANSTSTLLKFKAASNNPDDINPTTGTIAMTFTVNGATSGSNVFTTTAWAGISYNGTVFGALSPTVTVTAAPTTTITTVLSSSIANTSTYGDSATFTATVTAANGTASPTGSVEFFDGATSLGIDSVADSTGSGTSTWSFTTSGLNSGNHVIRAVYTPTGSFTGSTSGNITQIVNKADATINVTPYNLTYNANAHSATGTATGVGGVDLSAGLNLSGTTHTNAGTYTDTWTFAGNSNYNSASGTVTDIINKATATIHVNGYSGVYDAAAHGATGTATGVGGVDLSAGLTLGATFSNVPGGTANWSFSGGTNYNDQSGTAAIVIAKADLTINVSNLTKTFGQTINLATVLGTTMNTGINGETLTLSHSCGGTSASALVGNYAINCAVSGDGTGKMSNYNVIFNPGTLMVTAPSTITVVQNGGDLIIVGTEGTDSIDVNANNPSAITINGKGSYSVSPTGRVIVYGLGSADNINLNGSVTLEAHGGYGNDTITGGAGNDVIWGDQGDDTVTGSAGNDVLVGGTGSDRLVGAAGHDILIAGELSAGPDYAAMRTLSDNWAVQWGTDPDLVDNNADGDFIDESGDQLTGSAGHDWFIISSNDKITDINSATKDGDIITKLS